MATRKSKPTKKTKAKTAPKKAAKTSPKRTPAKATAGRPRIKAKDLSPAGKTWREMVDGEGGQKVRDEDALRKWLAAHPESSKRDWLAMRRKRAKAKAAKENKR